MRLKLLLIMITNLVENFRSTEFDNTISLSHIDYRKNIVVQDAAKFLLVCKISVKEKRVV